MQGQQTQLEVAVVGKAISLTLHHLDLVVDSFHHSCCYLVVIPGEDTLPMLEHALSRLDNMPVLASDGPAYASIQELP